MLIVAGWFEVDPGARDAFITSKVDAMTTSRGETGCLDYVFSADPVVPGRVVLYELWQDKAALGAHLAALQAHPPAPDPTVIRFEIQQYEIASVGPLGS